MLKTIVFIHILYKTHKKESQKTHNCIPYRLELTNWTPVKNKDQAETYQNKPKNLDAKIHSRPGGMSTRLLGIKGTQPERRKRQDETKDVNRAYITMKSITESYRCWKTRKKKTNNIVITIS